MTQFTNHPLERMMQQIPKAGLKETPRIPAPNGRFCHGCGRYGTVRVRPCYRDAKQAKKQQPKL